MKRKIISLLTTLVMIVGLVGVIPAVNAGAAGGVKLKLDSFISKYPKSYRIDRREYGTEAYKTIATVKGTTYTDKGLQPATGYFYRVYAVKNDIISDRSESVGTYTKLDKPIATVKAESSTSIKVTWKSVKNAKSYRIDRREYEAKAFKTIATVKGTTYTDKGLKPATGYYYRVYALKNDIISDSSESIGTYSKKCTHIYDNGKITTVATCTTDGKKTYTCTVCGSTKIETIPAIGHKSVTDKAQHATCTENGKTEGSHCSVCGEIIKEQEIIQKLGHNYKSNATPVTCTTDGIITYTCSTCGDTYNETIPASGHKYEDIAYNPTCTEQGYTEHKCSVCGDVYKDDYTDAIGHNYASTITSESTCTTDGVITYTCSLCDDTYTEIISATGHNYIEEVINPTEKEQGYTLHTCTICGDSYKDNYTDYKPTGILMGDINKDGKITTADVGLANAHAKGTKQLSGEALEKADINKDGKVSTADVGLINAYAKGTKKISR